MSKSCRPIPDDFSSPMFPRSGSRITSASSSSVTKKTSNNNGMAPQDTKQDFTSNCEREKTVLLLQFLRRRTNARKLSRDLIDRKASPNTTEDHCGPPLALQLATFTRRPRPATQLAFAHRTRSTLILNLRTKQLIDMTDHSNSYHIPTAELPDLDSILAAEDQRRATAQPHEYALDILSDPRFYDFSTGADVGAEVSTVSGRSTAVSGHPGRGVRGQEESVVHARTGQEPECHGRHHQKNVLDGSDIVLSGRLSPSFLIPSYEDNTQGELPMASTHESRDSLPQLHHSHYMPNNSTGRRPSTASMVSYHDQQSHPASPVFPPLYAGSTASTTGSPGRYDQGSSASPERDSTGAPIQGMDEEKRRRNTAASARFRVKKKQREAQLEATAKEMTEKVAELERKISQLELENRWLKNLLVEKEQVDKRPQTELGLGGKGGSSKTGVGTGSGRGKK